MIIHGEIRIDGKETKIQMIKKVYEFIQKNHMIEKDDVIIAGISGGADSVCLLLLLQEIKQFIPFSIHVVHINHQIRTEAIEDENFVVALCSQLNITCDVVRKNVEVIAKEKHITTEEAGREVRYQAFEKYLKKYAENGNGKIAVAHNKNDSAETVLFHLFRGSGMQGLTGIAPVRDYIIRPLLCVERKEIEEFLTERKQAYCTDQTNFTDDYARNRIRHHILGTATNEICQEAIAHTQEAADKIAQFCDLLQKLTQKGYESCCKLTDEKLFIDKEKLFEEEEALRGNIILSALARLMGTRKDLSSVHVDSLLLLFDKQAGRKIDLPYGYEAIREYDGVVIQNKVVAQKRKEVQKRGEEIIFEPEENVWKEIKLWNGSVLEFGVFTSTETEIIPEKTYTKWFDYDKIKGRLTIRQRMTGDYFTVNNIGQKQTLKSFFVNEKVPRQERDFINLLADENHIMWIIGYRISSYYKVGKSTRKILKVNLRGGAQNG